MPIDATACLNAGKCIALTKTAFYIMIGIYSFAGILLVMLFIIAFFTPGIVFLKAKLKKSPLIYIVNRGQKGRFFVGKQKTEGIVDIDRVGPIIISENSHTIEHKSGTPLFFAFGEFAGSLPLKWIYVINKMREKANKEDNPLTNVDELAGKLGLKFDDIKKLWVKT